MSSAEGGKSAGDMGFDFKDLLGKLAENKGKAKVEPTSHHRQTAREVAQQFVAYRDEGFTRAESIHLASLLVRSVYEAQAKDFIEKQDNDGT
jgi:hypothetical protein